jgi:hypothetical protein
MLDGEGKGHQSGLKLALGRTECGTQAVYEKVTTDTINPTVNVAAHPFWPKTQAKMDGVCGI